MTKSTVKVSKLDAARCQLECAAELYFRDGDQVSIHTLAAAAFEILSDLAKQKGDSMPLKRTVNSLPKDLAKKLWHHLRKPQNFFKHADRDGLATIEFSPMQAEVMLMDGTAKYWQLTGEQPEILWAFEKWFVVTYPELWKDHPKTHAMFKEAKRLFGGQSRREFLEEFRTHAAQAGSKNEAPGS